MASSRPTLMPFQHQGVEFLLQHPHRILADDMGLGKTAQAITAIKKLPHVGKVLILCPASVKYNWVRELELWGDIPQHQCQVINSGKDLVAGRQFTIVNYDLVWRKNILRQLKEQHYGVLICDEAHYLKGLKSKRTVWVLGNHGIAQQCHYKFFLTGTPMLSRPIDLFPVLVTCFNSIIEPYNSWVAYGKRFCNGHKDHYGLNTWDFSGASNLDDLRERLSQCMLRRTKEEVLEQLPDTIETTITLDLKVDSDAEYVASERNDIAAQKVHAIIPHIKDTLEDIPKLVIFTLHRVMTETLVQELPQYNPAYVYGGLTADEKDQQVQRFINDPHCKLFVGQIRATGVGVDGLQKVCSHVFFAETDWSPGAMDQARDRLRRIGQKDTVFVTTFQTKDELEYAVAESVRKKRTVIRTVLGDDDKEPIDMSLEKAIGELKTAVEDLTALLKTAGDSGLPVAKAEEPDTLVKEPPGTKPNGKKSGGGAKKAEEKKDEAPAEDPKIAVRRDKIRALGAEIIQEGIVSEDERAAREGAVLQIIQSTGAEKISGLAPADMKGVYDRLAALKKQIDENGNLTGDSDGSSDDEWED